MSLQVSSFEFRQSQAIHWQQKYADHLQQRLVTSHTYIKTAPRQQIRAHLGSFLNLLAEAQRYPHLTDESLKLIEVLHPWPLRWGAGFQWEVQLAFAVLHTRDPELRARYHNSLVEIYLSSGNFEKAAHTARNVLLSPRAPHSEAARAVRLLYRIFNADGRPDEAVQLMAEYGSRFAAGLPAHQIEPQMAEGWLRFNQCRLEQLRLQGKSAAALELVEEMIWLDDRLGAADITLTADLYTDRSTLAWSRGDHRRAAADLKHAMTLYQSIDDVFNAESLQSNLGLVYWTMGELDKAESALQTAIQFYRRSASDQLLTYDLGNMGLVHFSRGNLQAARGWTLEHIEHAQKLNFISEYHRGRHNLGNILYFLGDYEKALVEIEYVQPYRIKHGRRESHGLDMLYLALIKQALGEPGWALAKTREIAAWAQAEDLQVLEQITLRCLAFLAPPAEKILPLQRSLALARSQERKMEEAACLLLLAPLLEEPQEQQATWQNGAHLLSALGAGAWLKDRSAENPPFLPLSL